MSQVDITVQLYQPSGDSAADDKARTLRYRISENSQYSGQQLYPTDWQAHSVTSTASTISLIQGEYYDIRADWMNKRWNNCLAPSTASTSFAVLVS